MAEDDKNNIWGFGSVGISFIDYLQCIGAKNLSYNLFVKKKTEKRLERKSLISSTNKLKYKTYLNLKEKVVVSKFDKNSVIKAVETIQLTESFSNQTIFTIIGLGGSSGDALLNLSDLLIHGDFKEIVHFCIMPFNFEGTVRVKKAEDQLRLLQQKPRDGKFFVLSNQNFIHNADKQMTFDKAFKKLNCEIESIILSYKYKPGHSIIDLRDRISA